MRHLINYIQKGKGYGIKKMLIISLVFCILIAVFLYTTLNNLSNRLETDTSLNDMPTISIQNGQITQPRDTFWVKKIDIGTPLTLQIDTRPEADKNIPNENGIYLTSTTLYLRNMNQTQAFKLPTDDLSIDKAMLINMFRLSIHATVLVFVLSIFSILWLGFLGTIAITSLILWVVQKQTPKKIITRSSLIGWLGILIVDLLSLLFSFGFSLMTATFIASLISLFCILIPTETSD